VVQTGLKFTILLLPSAEITGMHHHSQLKYNFIINTSAVTAVAQSKSVLIFLNVVSIKSSDKNYTFSFKNLVLNKASIKSDLIR
jgi:hypothetical protein